MPQNMRLLSDRQLMEEIYIKLNNIHIDIEKLNYKFLRMEEKLQRMEGEKSNVVVYGGMCENERKELQRLRNEVARRDLETWYENELRGI